MSDGKCRLSERVEELLFAALYNSPTEIEIGEIHTEFFRLLDDNDSLRKDVKALQAWIKTCPCNDDDE